MLKTFEAVLEPDGRVQTLEELDIPRPIRVLLTILEDHREAGGDETALMS